eukprot:Sdes_comp19774_c2_seq1m11832
MWDNFKAPIQVGDSCLVECMVNICRDGPIPQNWSALKTTSEVDFRAVVSSFSSEQVATLFSYFLSNTIQKDILPQFESLPSLLKHSSVDFSCHPHFLLLGYFADLNLIETLLDDLLNKFSEETNPSQTRLSTLFIFSSLLDGFLKQYFFHKQFSKCFSFRMNKALTCWFKPLYSYFLSSQKNQSISEDYVNFYLNNFEDLNSTAATLNASTRSSTFQPFLCLRLWIHCLDLIFCLIEDEQN